jgi:hypothetical protein
MMCSFLRLVTVRAGGLFTLVLLELGAESWVLRVLGVRAAGGWELRLISGILPMAC